MGLRRAHVGNRRSYVVTMATLQDIPSGEALATSRPKINSNFAALNTELGQKETPTGAQSKADAAQAAAISAAATDATTKADAAGAAAIAAAAADATAKDSALVTSLPAWSQPGTTAAAARNSLGFGGTVTVAQLNAAGADARSAMYYCSDCLTVNGPGSLVAWCGRTLTWRTLDDCLLATTDFVAWCDDFVRNSNTNELRGTNGALFCALESGSLLHVLASVGTGSGVAVVGEVAGRPLRRRLNTGGGATIAYAREYCTAGSFLRNVSGASKVFAGVRGNVLSAINANFGFRVGIGNVPPIPTLATDEDSLAFDASNSMGVNAGLAAEWLACVRAGSVNLAGSGPLGSAPVANVAHDICVVRNAGTISMRVDGSTVFSGTNAGTDGAAVPFCIVWNAGVLASISNWQLGFCSGFLLP